MALLAVQPHFTHPRNLNRGRYEPLQRDQGGFWAQITQPENRLMGISEKEINTFCWIPNNYNSEICGVHIYNPTMTEFDTKPLAEAFYGSQNCINCGETLSGRRDKKFCDDHCRSLYHNQTYAPDYNLIRKTHTILRKNRRILLQAGIAFGERNEVPSQWLTEQGFSFQHCTQWTDRKKTEQQIICYDIAYQWLDREHVRIFYISADSLAA